jgi:hypothetical protein
MNLLIFLLAAAAALPLAKSEAEVRPDPRAPATSARAATAATVLVVFGSDTVRAEVADTPETRSQGLMYRDAVPDGTGMLFVWDTEAERSIWMQNTYVALDVAFIDRNFRIVDIQQLEPETTDIHDGASPAMFVLEVRQGWFAEKGIVVGDRCQLIFSG